jgi:hypothetical protein
MSFFKSERKPVGKINNLLSVNGFACTESLKTVVTVNHPEDVVSFGPFRRDIYVFFRELPSVRNTAFRADMGFVATEKIDFPSGVRCFKFLRLPGLVLTELRRGYVPSDVSLSVRILRQGG